MKDKYIGDLVRSKDLGIVGNNGFVWSACPKCGKKRYVPQSKPNRQCYKCGRTSASLKLRGSQCYNWKGGNPKTIDGYNYVYVEKTSKYAKMVSQNVNRYAVYIKEHRLVMAKHLGRCLEPHEYVHHINGNKKDNRLENLYLTNKNEHKLGYGQAYQDGFKAGYEKCMEDMKNGKNTKHE